ncbi:MAG: translocation/assembly module TamB domain-containing protein [Pseudomonadota bacterium]
MTARVLLRLFAVLGLLVLFGVAAAGALVLHADLPAARRLAARSGASVLGSTLQGSFSIGGVERLGLSGATLVDVNVADPEGRRVLYVRRLSVRTSVLSIASELWLGDATVTIVLDEARIEGARVHLFESDDGAAPSIARAFTPRPRPSDGEAGGRPVRVLVPSIFIDRAEGKGRVAGFSGLAAEVTDARGRLRASAEGVDLTFPRFGLSLRGVSSEPAQGIGKLRLRAPEFVNVGFEGRLGDVALQGAVRVEDQRVAVTVEVPHAEPDAVRALWPAYPLLDAGSAHLEVSGEPPNLTANGRLDVGGGVVLVTGPVTVSKAPSAELEVHGRRVNVKSLLPGAPATELDVVAHVGLSSVPQGAAVDVTAKLTPNVVEGVALPPVTVAGRFEDGSFVGGALLSEPGFPLHAEFTAKPGGAVTARLSAKDVELSRVPRLAPVRGLSGRVSLSGEAVVEDGTIQAQLAAEVARFTHGSVHVGRGAVTARARGSLENLEALPIDAALTASGVRAGPVRASRVRLHATGTASAPSIEVSLADDAGGTLTARTALVLRDETATLERPELDLRRDRTRLSGSAARVVFSPEEVSIRDLVLAGAGGRLSGSFRASPRALEVDARSEALDLAALGQLAGLEHALAGKLDLDAELVVARDVERGRVRAELTNVAFGPLAGVTVAGHATLESSRLDVTAGAILAGVGDLRLVASGELGGRALLPEAWAGITGEASVDVARLDLAALSGLVPIPEGISVSGAAGAQIRVARKRSERAPHVSARALTETLVVTRTRDGGSFTVQGVDAQLGLTFDGTSGDLVTTAKLVDPGGLLATATAHGKLDPDALLAGTSLVPALLTMPITGKAIVQERRLGDLPEIVQLRGVSGRVRLEATVAGTLQSSELFARGSVQGLEVEAARAEAPLDLCTTLGWSPGARRVTAQGELFLSTERGTCAGRRVVRYALDGRFEGPSRPGEFTGNAVAALEGLPIETVPGLGNQGLTGRISGSVSFSRARGAPVLTAELDLAGTRLEGAPLGNGRIHLRSNQRSVGATLTLSRDAGRLEATAFALLDSSSAVPMLDPKSPIGLRVVARDMDAVILQPILRDVFSEIGGSIDAELTAQLAPRHTAPEELGGEVSGRASLRNGNLQLAGLGLRLHDVSLSARAESAPGETRIVVDALSARAGRRRERLTVQKGKIWLDGLRVARAEGVIEAVELPLLLEGVWQATATTRQGIAFRLRRVPQRMEVDFDVPYLVVALPESSARNVISLAENETIEVIQPLGEPKERGGQALPWLLTFTFGRDVKLTRSDLDLPLSGTARVGLAKEVEVGGDLELAPGGRIQVSGKTFVIESGEVHFDTGDPGNPRVRIAATWRAPDATQILAEVSGTLREGRLRLTSDPPRSEQEIHALLLGGSSGEGGGDAAVTSASVGADILGTLLVNTPLRRVELRAGSEQSADRRSYSTYSAAVPIGDDIWFEGSYKLLSSGDPNAATQAVSGTIDWRFRRNWSLRTEVGTIGTGLDLVWQYRY